MSQTKSVLKAAYSSGRIGRDPTLGLVMPKVRAGQPDGRVPPDHVPHPGRGPHCSPRHSRPLSGCVALGVTGLRIGEVLAVTADRLDLERRRLVVDCQLPRIAVENRRSPRRKPEKIRTLVLPGQWALELQRHLRDDQGGGVLFRGARGAMMRRDRSTPAWRPALVGAGLVRRPLRVPFSSPFRGDNDAGRRGSDHGRRRPPRGSVETVQRGYAHWLLDTGPRHTGRGPRPGSRWRPQRRRHCSRRVLEMGTMDDAHLRRGRAVYAFQMLEWLTMRTHLMVNNDRHESNKDVRKSLRMTFGDLVGDMARGSKRIPVRAIQSEKPSLSGSERWTRAATSSGRTSFMLTPTWTRTYDD